MEKFNSILYGEAGAGKTPLCGTLEAYPKTSPCLFLDIDHGTLSLHDCDPMPTVHTINTYADMQVVYNHLKMAKWDALAKTIGIEKPLEFKSVVIDSGTELATILLRSFVEADDRNEGIADQSAYQKCQIKMAGMWRKFRDLPLSTVMTAGVKDQKDDVAGIVRFFPEFSPGLLHDLQRHTDLILFMNVTMESDGAMRRWTRFIQTQPTQRFVARDRSGTLPHIIKGDRLCWEKLLKNLLM